VIAVAVGLGVLLARRVTRRVSVLAEATRRVGAGDLSVQVPTDTADEVGELTRSFNEMVEDMRVSRGRIDYLQRISAWQDFARRLAHEIKNPLTPIQLAVQEVHRTYDGTDEKHRRRLEDARAIVEEEIATLRRLVGEFSAFAKLPEAQLAPADLGDFVRDASRTIGVDEGAADAEDEPDAKGAELTLEVESAAMPVKIDAMMLKRCLDNLARNAMHAARAKHPEQGGRVVVAARRTKAEAVLEVRDNGAGVPVDKRARVFDPYYTTKAEGTGLGLAIVKKVILEHQGEIEVLDAPEGGATFRIRLPISEQGRAR
jgi:nitrogen fixation/metabolism regulation signal transduction histidine kinase